MPRRTLAILVILTLWLLGCSKDSSSVNSPTTSPNSSLVVSPSDGEANVRLDAVLTVTFAYPVDRAIVEQSIHLISENSIADTLCPDSSMASHGGMTGIMTDTTMMHHMDQVHATRGKFTWYGDSTTCYFRPDSLMSPRTQYMIHIDAGMMQMMRSRMGEISMSGTHGSGTSEYEMTLHFETLDTANTGGGHASHH